MRVGCVFLAKKNEKKSINNLERKGWNRTFAPAFRDTGMLEEEFFERFTYNESSTRGWKKPATAEAIRIKKGNTGRQEYRHALSRQLSFFEATAINSGVNGQREKYKKTNSTTKSLILAQDER